MKLNFRIIKFVAWLTIATVLLIGLVAACGGGEPEELEIAVSVEGESMSPETIKVKQGDMVTLKIQVEKAGEFHLHGYDIEQDIEPGPAADFLFLADATGRFKITFHHAEEGEEDHEDEEDEDEDEDEEDHEDEEGEEIEIGYLEVGPR